MSGLPGMCSIHANSARDALVKLCTLPLLAGRNIDSSFVVPTVAASIDIVVLCELAQNGTRRITERPGRNITRRLRRDIDTNPARNLGMHVFLAFDRATGRG